MSSPGADPARRRVTSTDVAREAGVSRATVSYVLNRDSRQSIPDVTRQKVLDASARLGYRPYGPARLLRGARSSVVLMLTPGLEHASDFVAAGIITSLGAATRHHGLHLVWQLGAEELETAIDLAPAVVLTSVPDGDPLIGELSEQFSVPVASAFPHLDAFLAASASAQVEHLVARGRRRLAFAAPARPELGATATIRHRAANAAAAAAGIPLPHRFEVPDDRAAAGAALRAELEAHPELDGICAFNDEVAFAVLAAAADSGIPVPARIAVIGVDNHPFGPLTCPALSTVESDVDAFVTQFAAHVAQLAAGEAAEPPPLPDQAHAVPRAST
ncbi:LacI family DNA-binding transcriptional regulator [Propioniciclava soli]|uniref:LacI family DNA-binding transcriptional regulator n=1 Tax=Propioniciclava soli TaxID=2775081 RepID=A0ABZ3C986_9ACTN